MLSDSSLNTFQCLLPIVSQGLAYVYRGPHPTYGLSMVHRPKLLPHPRVRGSNLPSHPHLSLHLFLHISNKYLLSISQDSDLVLGTEDTGVKRKDTQFHLMELTI